MLLPVFKNRKELIGTAFMPQAGVIVTAAHCFYIDKPNCLRLFDYFTVLFKGVHYDLNHPIYEDYKPLNCYSQDEREYRDLAIFNTNIKIKDGEYKNLAEKYDFEFKDAVKMHGFDDTTDEVIKECKVIYSSKAFTNIGSNTKCIMSEFHNLFRTNGFIGEGSSGGIVIKNGQCYGMIVFGLDSTGTTAIKSCYIADIMKFLYTKGLI